MSEKTILPFIAPFKSVVIGTIGKEGLPFSSYAPFVHYDHRFYIFISDIATHAQNLKREDKASLFFIEDETQAANIFARKRISLQCDAALIPRDNAKFTPVMAYFSNKFGSDMIDMLLNMGDFNLYELTTASGEATFGFGEAYIVGGKDGEMLLPRQGGSGHK
ncbi:MAG: pyridoxamine 5'-phosphate oxidase family protein [Helicobacteraceae bacterium]|jgi:putative heme iron utilization protein|nr:pyridoxamine 5'-phosphate oxidase family protein [Helicobacteraceae bacterium]